MSKQGTENYTKSHQNTAVFSISTNYLFGPKAHCQVEHMNKLNTHTHTHTVYMKLDLKMSQFTML